MSPHASIAKRLLSWTARTLLAIVLAIVIFEVAIAGLGLRRWAWDFTQPVRFAGDMERNFLYGSRAASEGYFNVYENVYVERDPGDYDIDYPPLRLLTFDLWIQYLKRQHHDVSTWDSSYEFNSPLLTFNTFTESASVIAVFLIIRRWTRNPRPGKKLRPDGFLVSEGQNNWESWSRAGLGALLVWFTPGALADGHGWATYDVWIPPFYLWAILLVSHDCWLLAGVALGIGAMFKGQMLLAAPIFIAFPLLAGQPKRALRLLAGFTLATATVAAPFILSSQTEPHSGIRIIHWHAVTWIASVAIAGALPHLWRLPRVLKLSKIVRRFLVSGLFEIAALLALWPILLPGNHALWPMMLPAIAIYLTLAWFLRGRWLATLIAAATAASVFASMALFENNPAWWTIGFRYGSEKFFHLIQGHNANLPALLQTRFGWNGLTDIALTIPAHLLKHWPANPIELNNRQFLLTLYFIALALCSVAAAIHWRRRDRRFLIALSTVWLMFYCLLPQMIGRYLLFGSTVGAIAVSESIGLGLITFFLSVVTAICTLQEMSHDYYWGNSPNADIWQTMVDLFGRTTPPIAWAVLMASAVFLCLSLNLTRRSSNPGTRAPG